ncbi:MAG: hypothetical protein UY44_C0016G0001 [Candidatus Kaiserbacteria bacterium GW2011_GWA2_49_19]|uniref:Uncharacterized protein n=1 Tax=Candidatus Kaiserbacteria bacterium GW2011_GWA2_49_19 TaxID=1618669 RepID=A0A0G1VNZ2_9BACT|nr:MAG: hypothetical protein UY44_C0016G0001 [Candidatus Kaiserbacteria bacterium GW2011_GWA2_49_19]
MGRTIKIRFDVKNESEDSMNPFLSAYALLQLVTPVDKIPKGSLLLMAHGMREAFKPAFEHLMSPATRGIHYVLGEVAPFHVPSGSVVPNTVTFNGMSAPPNFRCMLLACLSTDSLFPIKNIASGLLGSDVIKCGQDQWLIVSLECQWFALTRTFSLRDGQEKNPSPELQQAFYLVDPLSDDCLAESLLKSPGAILQMARAFSWRCDLQADSLENELTRLREGERFGEIFHDLLEKAGK